MAKTKRNNDIILTQGLLIGDDTTRLINLTEKNDILQLDYTLFCPQLETDPDKILNAAFIKKLTTHPQRVDQLYAEAITNMYGENLADIGFNENHARSGLTFTFQEHAEMKKRKHPLDDPRFPTLVSVTPVLASVEKQISFDVANDDIDDHRDARLDMMQSFMHGHDIIAPRNGRFGDTYNAQTMMLGIGNLAYSMGSNIVFKNKIESVHRIRRENDVRHNFEKQSDFINTRTALARKLHNVCKTFFNLNVHDAALFNLTALHGKQQNTQVFSAQHTNILAYVHTQQARRNNNLSPKQRYGF